MLKVYLDPKGLAFVQSQTLSPGFGSVEIDGLPYRVECDGGLLVMSELSAPANEPCYTVAFKRRIKRVELKFGIYDRDHIGMITPGRYVTQSGASAEVNKERSGQRGSEQWSLRVSISAPTLKAAWALYRSITDGKAAPKVAYQRPAATSRTEA